MARAVDELGVVLPAIARTSDGLSSAPTTPGIDKGAVAQAVGVCRKGASAALARIAPVTPLARPFCSGASERPWPATAALSSRLPASGATAPICHSGRQDGFKLSEVLHRLSLP